MIIINNIYNKYVTQSTFYYISIKKKIMIKKKYILDYKLFFSS